MSTSSLQPANPVALRVKSLADTLLTQSGIWENPYFRALCDGNLSLERFRASQEQFYFAVLFFSRPMAGLIARLPDYASRASILENVLEEHGHMRLADSHAATFEAFLRTIGSDVLPNLHPGPAVHAFNSVLLSVCLLEEIEVGIACLGIIELAFARLSAQIGQAVVHRGWVPSEKLVHYARHAELDHLHAQEFFALIEPKWPAQENLIHRGLSLGAHVFDRLYRDLVPNP